MSKKNHTLATIIIILCLVIGGTLLFYHFAPSSPTRIPPKNLPPSQTPINEIKPSTAHIEESKDSVYKIVAVLVIVFVVVVYNRSTIQKYLANHLANHLEQYSKSKLKWFLTNVAPILVAFIIYYL